jgi:hypothetical protein
MAYLSHLLCDCRKPSSFNQSWSPRSPEVLQILGDAFYRFDIAVGSLSDILLPMLLKEEYLNGHHLRVCQRRRHILVLHRLKSLVHWVVGAYGVETSFFSGFARISRVGDRQKKGQKL